MGASVADSWCPAALSSVADAPRGLLMSGHTGRDLAAPSGDRAITSASGAPHGIYHAPARTERAVRC